LRGGGQAFRQSPPYFDSKQAIIETIVAEERRETADCFPELGVADDQFGAFWVSLREVSYSRLLAFEAGRLLECFGCEVRIFDPKGLPLPDDAPASHAKVKELRADRVSSVQRFVLFNSGTI
jgi:hypothetical protein